MAKFLDTQAISNELMKIIKEAKEKIILVSYSFKVNPQIQERLKTKSKIGTLSEIVIVYGKTEESFKRTELDWVREIQDIKIFEKINLHAKCYLNEERAIICSMNLYNYSQQNNIEMGILITKQDDREAYDELIEEINNIKVNGVRKNFELLTQGKTESEIDLNSVKKTEGQTDINREIPAKPGQLSIDEKLKFQLLRKWRYYKSKADKSNVNDILTEKEIVEISTRKNLDKNQLFEILPKKKAIQLGNEIIEYLSLNTSSFIIAKVIGTWYQDNNDKYDRVKLKIISTGEERWFDTVKELPEKDRMIGAKLNNSWFNDYVYIED